MDYLLYCEHCQKQTKMNLIKKVKHITAYCSVCDRYVKHIPQFFNMEKLYDITDETKENINQLKLI